VEFSIWLSGAKMAWGSIDAYSPAWRNSSARNCAAIQRANLRFVELKNLDSLMEDILGGNTSPWEIYKNVAICRTFVLPHLAARFLNAEFQSVFVPIVNLYVRAVKRDGERVQIWSQKVSRDRNQKSMLSSVHSLTYLF
jgi:hypothetical protein